MKCSLLVLSSYLDGELEARRQGELEAHLVGCQRCRAGLGYLREEVDRVSSLGRVHVAEHSVHALLSQLGLAGDEGGAATAAVLEHPRHSSWFGDARAAALTWEPDAPEAHGAPEAPNHEQHGEPEVELGGSGALPSPDEGVPAVPFGFQTQARPEAIVPPSPPPPVEEEPSQHPPPTASLPPSPSDEAPPPSMSGAFPPGGPDTSDLPPHDPAPGGEPAMTASPPWTPGQAPTTEEPIYPLTDDDVLDAPLPVERFAPPQQAPRPGLVERIRDRLAVRRALSRSTADFDDSVQIVSGTGASMRPGHARAEVERRRHLPLRGRGEDTYDEPPMADDEAFDPFAPAPPPRTRDGRTGSIAGQMPLPGTEMPRGDLEESRSRLHDLQSRLGHPDHPEAHEPRHPVNGFPTPPRHNLGSALDDIAGPHAIPPPVPPRAPVPDPLGEALSGLDRVRTGGAAAGSRSWRPREIPEDLDLASGPAPAARRFDRLRGAVTGQGRRSTSPAQLREGRRLLVLFGLATVLMLIVGIVSGRSSSPLPTDTASHATPSKPKAQTTHNTVPRTPATAAPVVLGPGAQTNPSGPAATPQLTGVHSLGDSGTGWQVKAFRYGIHPNDFRIVLDLTGSGATSGTPKATLGFVDPTTLLVVLDGVVPAGSAGQLPSTNPVTAVTLLQPSPFPDAITYQIKLSRAVSLAASYATSPLRLVIDLGT